jgi:hypothetical protein
MQTTSTVNKVGIYNRSILCTALCVFESESVVPNHGMFLQEHNSGIFYISHR